MKNFPKAGLLIITLVIPALTFLLLKLFATNHYDLPYFNPEVTSNGQVVVVNGDTTFRKSPSIQLASGNVNLDGQIALISFLPENCTDSCKLVLANLKRIYDMRNAIANLSIKTLAPGNANIPVESSDEMGKEGWNVIKASQDDIAAFMNAQSPYFKATLELYPEENRLILIDAKGFTRGYYNGTDSKEIDRLMAELKILDYETEASANR